MIGLDTNILVRFLVRDDQEQHERACALLRRGSDEGEVFFIPDVVLAEVAWVLKAWYHFEDAEIGGAIRGLASAERLEFESVDRLMRALSRFDHGKGGFADYLIAERCREADCGSVATFDRALLDEPQFLAP